jgi:hypothetical protein
MKWLLLLLCFVDLCSKAQGVTSSKVPLTFSIHGTLTTSSSYCGGAAPTPEIEKYYQENRPYGGWVYFRHADSSGTYLPAVDSVLCDKNGNFSVDLQTGEYIVFTYECDYRNYNKLISQLNTRDLQIDNNCLDNWFRNGLFKVSGENGSVNDLNYNFYSPCFVPVAIPCVFYTGPYPP